MRALYPVADRWARRELSVARADAGLVLAEFDFIAERLADGRRHLCGDRFTAADLTFACLAAAVVLPPEYGVALPQPLPELRVFREHPAGATRSSSSASSGARGRRAGGSQAISQGPEEQS